MGARDGAGAVGVDRLRAMRAATIVGALSRAKATRGGFDGRAWLRAAMADEEQARTAFFLLPLGLMVGILLVYGVTWRPGPLWCLGATLGFGSLAWRGGSTGVAAFAACVALGAASATFELARTKTVVFSGEATVRIEGRVVWRDRDERNRIRYLVAIDRTERPSLSRPPGRAEILVAAKHIPIPIGGRYKGLVRLRPPSGPALPGGYDFAFGAYFEGLGAYGFALGGPDRPAGDDTPPTLSVAERFVELRLAMSDRIRAVIGGGEGAVAAAIIAGERTGIPDDVDHWLRVTGLSHVLSISGLHMALVAGFAMVLVRCLCAAIPAVALHLPAKKIGATAALGVSAFYLALSGVDVATTRSFLMIAIMLGAILFDRAALTLRNVALAAMAIFLTTPHALLTASFQMSFGATAAIVGIYGAFSRWHHARSGGTKPSLARRIALSLAGIALSSTVAGLATAPFAAFHFQRMAPFGLLANMLALPIFSFWIMPLALVAVVAMPFGLDALFFRLLGQGLALVFAIAHFLADRLPDSPTGLLTVPGVLVLGFALVVGCFLASYMRFVAIPIAAIGLALSQGRSAPPEMLVFEDGREAALLDADGRLSPLRARSNGFVVGQWRRAYPVVEDETSERRPPAFSCETIAREDRAKSSEPPERAGARKKVVAESPRRFCRATTRTGLRVVWTDDYRKLGQACDQADVAIVARAVRLTTCRSGARLITSRTLRITGSVAVSRSSDGEIAEVTPSIASPGAEEWNVQRLAPWPEAWRRAGAEDASASPPSSPRAAASTAGGASSMAQ